MSNDICHVPCSAHPEVHDAVAGLARHVCLKATDKAESRSSAITAASEMISVLQQLEQDQFVGFMYNLSRSSKARSCLQTACQIAGAELHVMYSCDEQVLPVFGFAFMHLC